MTPPDSNEEPRLSLDRLWVLMVTAFVDMIGFALVLPLLPYYATRFGATPFTVGLLVGIFAFAQMVTAPLWGRLSDSSGRRPVILGGQLLAACAFIVFAFADSVVLLFLCRLLQGAGGGTSSVTAAYVSDSAAPQERAKALGWLTACSSAGVMIGPAIASFTVGYGYELPGLIAAGFCVLNVLFAWRWLPESAPPKAAGSASDPQKVRQPLHLAIIDVVRQAGKPAHSLIWIYSCGMMAFMAMNGVLALYLADTFSIDEEQIGLFYTFIGLLSVIMRAVILGQMVKMLGEVRVMRCGALSLASGMMLAPFATNLWQFLPIVVLVPVGTALLFPSTTSLISRYSPDGEVGQSLGVQQAFGGASRLLGPIWGGFVYQAIGHGVPFWIGGGLVLLAASIALFHLQPSPKRRVERPASSS